MFRYKKVRRTTLIAVGCVSFLAGLALTQLGWHIFGWGWLLASLASLPLCFKKKLLVAVPVIVIIGVMLGLWRGSLAVQELSGYDPYVDQKVVLRGNVSEDPTYDDKGQLDMRLHDISIDGRALPGQVRVKAFGALGIRRGDTLEVTGKLRDGFGNYQAAIYFAQAKKLATHESIVDTVRRQFAVSVLNNVPEPQASLGLGFLVGQKTGLPSELDDQLKLLGLTHIVVASGFNLTILVRLAKRFFEKRSKYQTAAASLALMAGFVAVTGFSASMTRAALVTGLAVWAWYYGRRMHPIVLLLVAAAITTAVNPLYLWSDIGWWLSFLAFAGVMLLAPLLQRRIFGEREPKFLGQIVLETISAQLLTLPLILFIFGQLSILSIIANVLIVPLVPVAMLFTFVGGIAGFVLPVVAPVIALPATLLLSYITQVVAVLASVSWASVPVSISAPAMVVCCVAIAATGYLIWRKTGYNYLRRSVIE